MVLCEAPNEEKINETFAFNWNSEPLKFSDDGLAKFKLSLTGKDEISRSRLEEYYSNYSRYDKHKVLIAAVILNKDLEYCSHTATNLLLVD